MYVHSCCCILFSCIVWFEITFQKDLNLHSKFGWKLEKEKEKDFSSLPSIPACWPSRWPSPPAWLIPAWPALPTPRSAHVLWPALLCSSHARGRFSTPGRSVGSARPTLPAVSPAPSVMAQLQRALPPSLCR